MRQRLTAPGGARILFPASIALRFFFAAPQKRASDDGTSLVDKDASLSSALKPVELPVLTPIEVPVLTPTEVPPALKPVEVPVLTPADVPVLTPTDVPPALKPVDQLPEQVPPREPWKVLSKFQVIAAAVAISVGGWQLYSVWEQQPENLLARAANSLIASAGSPSSAVARPVYEEVLQSEWVGHDTGVYLVVVGAKGIGKSSTIRKVAGVDPGIVLVRISKFESEKQVCADVIEAFCRHEHVMHKALTLTHFGNLDGLEMIFSEARRRMLLIPGTPADWVPTVVVELQRVEHTGAGNIRSIMQVFKELCCDRRACAVVIVLSDPSDLLLISDDKARQETMFFEEMTPGEASQQLDQLGILLGNDALRSKLLDALDRAPQNFVKLAKKIKTGRRATPDQEVVEQFILSEQVDAEDRVKGFLQLDEGNKATQSAIRELINALIADGVKQEITGVNGVRPSASFSTGPLRDPELLSALMKQKRGSHAVFFNVRTKAWHFHSPACYVAAKKLMNPQNK